MDPELECSEIHVRQCNLRLSTRQTLQLKLGAMFLANLFLRRLPRGNHPRQSPQLLGITLDPGMSRSLLIFIERRLAVLS
jgi:hypothetical protein